jgi:hypothetical protein
MPTVNVLLPLEDRLAGANEQRLAAGRPEQAKVTVWLKPFTIATLIVVCPVCEFPEVMMEPFAIDRLKSATGAAVMVTVTAEEVIEGYLESPPYTAVMVCVPTLSVVVL